MAHAECMEFVEEGEGDVLAVHGGVFATGASEEGPAVQGAAPLVPPFSDAQGVREQPSDLELGEGSASFCSGLDREALRRGVGKNSPVGLPKCTDFPRDEGLVKEEDCDSPLPGARSMAQQDRDLPRKHKSSGPQLTGPRYFLPEVVYAPSDVDPNEVLNVPDSCPSQECLDAGVEAPTEALLRLHTWNVAGMSAKRVKTLVSQELDAEVIALQEYPKQEAGWQLVKGETYNGLIHQNYFMYRAVAIFYRVGVFHLLGRGASERGIWARLKHVATSKEVWIGCLRLPNNQPRDEIQRLLQQFMHAKAELGSVGAVLGDFNTQFKWSETENLCVPGVISARWADLRQIMSEHGFQQTPPPPHQAATPTFHSRKANTSSTQIDGCFVKGLKCAMNVAEGSRIQVGTDHDRVEMQGVIKGKGVRRKLTRGGGPMRVVASPPPVDTVDQQTLEALARKHCKPASLGAKFRPSPAVSTLRGIARQGRDAQAWKTYLQAHRKEKEAWQGERIERASSDWQLYKSLTKAKKAWGDEYMVNSAAENPVDEIKKHFDTVFHDANKQDVEQELLVMSQGLCFDKPVNLFSKQRLFAP